MAIRINGNGVLDDMYSPGASDGYATPRVYGHTSFTAGLYKGHNVISVTNYGTGLHQISMQNASSSNFFVLMNSYRGANGGIITCRDANNYTGNVSSFGMRTTTFSGTALNWVNASFMVYD